MPLLSRIRSAALSPALLVPLTVAVVTFIAAYDDGSYSLPSRNTLAIAIWWTVIVGVALRALTLESVTKASLAMGGILAALCAWTFASVFWAPSAENAFNEFNRVSLFLGLFVLATLAATRSSISRWCDGLAIAISLVAIIALVSRFFPGTYSNQGLNGSLRSVAARLSFPLGYWNGLAIFVALGVPLLLRIAVSSERPLVRGLSVVPIPAIACVIFLSSSRGGVFTVIIGLVAFLLLGERRWAAATALFWGALGSAAAIAVLDSRNQLVNGPLGTSLQRSEGRSATLLVALACVSAGAAHAAGRGTARRLIERGVSRISPWFGRLTGAFAGAHNSPRFGRAIGIFAGARRSLGRVAGTFATARQSPWLGRATVASVVGIFAVAIVLDHPIRQFEAFKRTQGVIPTSSYAETHLLSTSGSGRWQYWTEAIKQWENKPLAGEGAGSYEAWWTEHMTIPQPVKDSHSLYLQSLGELGIPGFALTLALAFGGIGIGIRRSLRSSGERRNVLAALAAVFTAFAIAAAFDWMWELTVVAGVGIVALALLSSAAGTDPGPPRLVKADEPRRLRQLKFGIGAMSLVGVWLLICAQGVPLLAQLRIRDSNAYAANQNTAQAIRAAMDARNLQPWASSPYLQLALLGEREGAIAQAHTWIEDAIERNPTDWQLWLVASRLDISLGGARAAERALNRAIELNPRSPLWRGG